MLGTKKLTKKYPKLLMQFYACQETVKGFQKCLMPRQVPGWVA